MDFRIPPGRPPTYGNAVLIICGALLLILVLVFVCPVILLWLGA